jgi:carboxyl-terminal processing protease
VRQDYDADGRGSMKDVQLSVLIDEGTASSSEIFSGAIQDNDRGTIIGRRSFGKGLVQEPINFTDGSGIRLTVARFYTPSGRCIQKPYEKGKDRNYELDIINRYEHGEFFSQDSIKQDESHIYYTSLGRPVYGGGGIMPDIFVPQDTTGITSYFSMAVNRGLTIQFAFQYTDQNRQKLQKYDNADDLLKYLKKQNILEKFAQFAESKGIKRRNLMMYKSRELFNRNLYGNIIYNMLNMEEYLKFLNQSDPTVQKALEVLKAGNSFPQAPEQISEEANEGTEKTIAKAN